MKFIDVAQSFDQIEKESSRLKITEMLSNLLKQATPSQAATIAYLSLGDLHPTYVGTKFNFAGKSMLKVLAKLLGVTDHTVKAKESKLGDLGLVALEVETNILKEHALTLHQVEKELDEFALISGEGSNQEKEKKLLELLKQLDPISIKYVVRIILGKLRLGFSDMTLLDAFSWMYAGNKSIRKDLEEAYNVCVDIGLIIKILKEDGLKGIKNIGIIPGVPVRPAAAERLPDAKSIIEKLGKCVAQPKLDGFRLQVHINKTHSTHDVHFFSRNLQDMSEMFPDLKKAALQLNVKTLVAEGEAISYDVETGTFLPFQETVKRRRKYDIEKMAEDFPLKLYMFDVLYMNGKSYLDDTHEERRAALLKLLDEEHIAKQAVIHAIEEVEINTAKELDEYFEQNISSGLEGLVVKKTDSIYQAGKRNFNWVKLKRQESGELNDTVDCVILGYYTGKGKRAAFGIGALLVGIYNKHEDVFQTIAKIGTGLTDEEWREQKKACDKIKIFQKPHNVQCSKELFPDVWVDPKIICMIRADEITLSPLHTAGKTDKKLGYALRFPRLMGYRPDKSATEATEIKEIDQLYKLQFNKSKKSSSSEKQRSLFDETEK
ncbi:MAG: ATP-dependent DNA ligase [Candidatus Babeliales bacterium]|jgi:DNA ligase-1